MPYCRNCGVAFQGEHWQKLCWPCWRKEQDFKKLNKAYAQGFAAARKMLLLEESLIRDLLILVHPDHQPEERQSLATDVTQRLLALRDIQRERT